MSERCPYCGFPEGDHRALDCRDRLANTAHALAMAIQERDVALASMDKMIHENDKLKAELKEWKSLHNVHLIEQALTTEKAKSARLVEALNDIASWNEGDEVRGNFDEPCSASTAREALAAYAEPQDEGKE